jgi:hypothetical protein
MISAIYDRRSVNLMLGDEMRGGEGRERSERR